MRFNKADLVAANARLSMLSYYPSSSQTQAAIMELLAKMCPSREALEWLIDTMTNRVGSWKGPSELRAVLCWKFKPADGIEADSTIPGFRPQDGEQTELERHAMLKAGGYSVEAVRLLEGIAHEWPKALPKPSKVGAA